MFNLPWYAWFNVLAIPMVWSMVLLGLKLDKAPKWQYTASSLGHVCAALMIFLHWNQQLSHTTMPLPYLIALMTLLIFLYCVVTSIADGVKTTYRAIRLQSSSTPTDSQNSSEQPANNAAQSNKLPKYVDGVFDIEEEYSCGDSENIRATMEAVFSPNKSIVDAPFMQDLSKEFSDEDLRDDGAATLATYWFTIGVITLILGPPGWMGFNLLKNLF